MSLTPSEENLLTWFREFQKTGGNQLTLARKDIGVMVIALTRLSVDDAKEEKKPGVNTTPPMVFRRPGTVEAVVAMPRAKNCADCNVEFGPTVVPRAMVVGKGPVCAFCAKRRGIA